MNWVRFAELGLREPAPSFPSNDTTDCALLYTKSGGYFGLRLGPGNFPYLTYLVVIQLRISMLLASVACPMDKLVRVIFLRCRPADMARIHTAVVSISAAMRSLMLWGRRLPIRQFAHRPGWVLETPRKSNYAIPAVIWGERPFEAFITIKRQRYINQKQHPALRQLPAIRAAVSPKALIMNVAHPKRSGWVGAAINFAYWFISHGAESLRGGQGRALLTQRFRPELHIKSMEFRQVEQHYDR